MEEIYWLQRLGTLNEVMWVLFTAAILVLALAVFFYIQLSNDYYCEEEAKKAKIAIWWSAPIVFISLCGGIFIPTTKELYVIYGVGGTIDYLKSNEKAKQLPDKVVNALDKWMDDVTNDDKEKEE